MTARGKPQTDEQPVFSLGTVQLLLIVIGLLLWSGSTRAQMSDDTLLPFAVNVERTPKQNWPGYGIYVGNGYFLTAAHVVGPGWLTKPRIVIDGQRYPTTIVKEGTFEGTDIALLFVNDALLPMRLALRRMKLCTSVPTSGEEVVTLVPGRIEHTHVFPPQMIPATARRFSTAVADVARTGNSGSGVFDLRHHCLAGIMSRKISETRQHSLMRAGVHRDIAKYFVPSSEIATFLPDGILNEFGR